MVTAVWEKRNQILLPVWFTIPSSTRNRFTIQLPLYRFNEFRFDHQPYFVKQLYKTQCLRSTIQLMACDVTPVILEAKFGV